MQLDGELFRPRASASERASLVVEGGRADIFVAQEPVGKHVEIETVQGGRSVFLKNGMLFVADGELDAGQLQLLETRARSTLRWLERFTFKRAVLFSLLLVAAVFAYRAALYAVNHAAVAVFPVEWEQAIGRNVYRTLGAAIFAETELPAAQRRRLLERAAQLVRHSAVPHDLDILFHRSDALGANALAFAGGPVVVTDGLVQLLDSDELTLAVIAHELAHVERRHSLQQIVHVLGATVVASVLLGSDNSLIEEASLVGIDLWALKNSRDFEREADLVALEIMDRAGLSRRHFAAAIAKLAGQQCGHAHGPAADACMMDAEKSWLSSHPANAERLRYLRELAAGGP